MRSYYDIFYKKLDASLKSLTINPSIPCNVQFPSRQQKRRKKIFYYTVIGKVA